MHISNYVVDDDNEIDEQYGDFNDQHLDNEDLEIQDDLSQVGSKPEKNIAILVIVFVLIATFAGYLFIFDDSEEAKEQAKKEEIKEIIESQPIEQAQKIAKPKVEEKIDIGIVEEPELLDITDIDIPPPSLFDDQEIEIPQNIAQPQIQETAIFEPPVTINLPEEITQTPSPIQQDSFIEESPVAVSNNEFQQQESPEEIAARRARRTADSVILNGNIGEPKNAGASIYSLEKTSFTQVTATTIGNTNITIAQGKLIDAILETAINTDQPGPLRAIVSRDVYSESGNNILISKGSRLIGTYEAETSTGQERIGVTWNRIIMPGGVDIVFESPGTDQLGRAGLTGNVDTKIAEKIGNAALISLFSIAGATIIDQVVDVGSTSSTTTTSSSGDTSNTNTGTPTDFAIGESLSDLSDLGKEIIGSLADTAPTITVDQGTKIKVFVNQDLVFPSHNTKFVN